MEDFKKIKIENVDDNKSVVIEKSFTGSIFPGLLIIFKDIFRMYFINITLINFI
jgi:hypothetical protein